MHFQHVAPLMYLLAFANIYSVLHLGLYIVGANTYDIKQFIKLKSKSVPKRGPKRRKWPLVSVVIPAHSEALVIERTIESVRASTYKNIEIIIVDDGSTDKMVKVVRSYIKKHPKLRSKSYVAKYNWTKAANNKKRYIRGQIGNHRILLISQKNAGKAAAMNNAIANHVRGELIMCLDADSILHKDAISNAVDYFSDPKIIGVAANVRIMSSKHWLGVLQRFEHMIGYRSKKFYSLTNSEFIIGGVASIYRTKSLKKIGLYDTDTMTEDIGLSLKLITSNGNKKKKIIYAADVVAMTEGVQSFKALLRQRYRWKMGNLQNLYKYRSLIGNDDRKKYTRMLTIYRLPAAVLSELMLLIEPILLGYVLYLSFHYSTFGILLGAYMTLTVYILWAIWPDEHLSKTQKGQLSLLAFIMYLLFYAMDVVQLFAAYNCVRNQKSIKQRDGVQTWVSPLRSGRAATF